MIIGLEICEEVNGQQPYVFDVNGNIVNDESGGGAKSGSFRRRMVEITLDMKDEEWIRHAQSCEKLDPGADTVMRVRRSVNSIGSDV